MKNLVNTLLIFLIPYYSFAQLAGERIIKGSERLSEFAKLIGAPYTNLTDSVANNFNNLESDLIRWASRNFCDKEVEYFTTKFDSSMCRDIVHNQIWNFDRNSNFICRLKYVSFKRHYLKPYNIKVQFKNRYFSEEKEHFFQELNTKNSEVLNYMYKEQYNIKFTDLLNKLYKINVSNVIYILGLIDSYKSIPLLESIIKDTLNYTESEIDAAKLALARLGNTKYEESVLVNLNSLKDTIHYEENINILNEYVYICTQLSAYKFTDFLRYKDDGKCLGFRWFYSIQEPFERKIRKFIFFHKIMINPRIVTRVEHLYISQRYLVLEYLIFALKNSFFKEVDFLDGFEVKHYGCAFDCDNIIEIDDCVENMLKWLEDNRGNYKLNRRILF